MMAGVKELLKEIGQGIEDFRLISPGFDGDAELRRLLFERRIVQTDEVPAPYDEPNTQTRKDVNYLINGADSS